MTPAGATVVPVLTTCVGADATSQGDWAHAVRTRTWGYAADGPGVEEVPQSGCALFATGLTGDPDGGSGPGWASATADLHVGWIRGGLYEASAPHWPDEVQQGVVLYPLRFGFLPLFTLERVVLAPDGPLPTGVVDALRWSLGRARRASRRVELDPGPLFRAAGLPAPPPGAEPSYADAPGMTDRMPAPRRRRAGSILDSALRARVDRHALTLALEQLAARGFADVLEVADSPGALRCLSPDGDQVHVRVHGTTGSGAAIGLQPEVVDHARRHRSVLVVVSDIVVDTASPPFPATGGTVRVLDPWWPEPADLRPTRLSYRVPSG